MSFSIEEKNKIKELALSGLNGVEIAKELGVPYLKDDGKITSQYANLCVWARKAKGELPNRKQLAEVKQEEARVGQINSVTQLCTNMAGWVAKLQKQYDQLSLDELLRMRKEIQELRDKQQAEIVLITDEEEIKRRREEATKTLELRIRMEQASAGDVQDLRHSINNAHKNFVELLKTPAISQNVDIKNWLQQIGVGFAPREIEEDERPNPITA